MKAHLLISERDYSSNDKFCGRMLDDVGWVVRDITGESSVGQQYSGWICTNCVEKAKT